MTQYIEANLTSQDPSNEAESQIIPTPSGSKYLPASSSYKTLQTSIAISGFVVVLLLTALILTYMAYHGRRERKRLEGLPGSQRPLSNRIDFDIELNVLINGHGPLSPGQARVLSVRQSVGSHTGRNRSAGQSLREDAAGRIRVAMVRPTALERRGPPVYQLGENRGRSLRTAQQMSRVDSGLSNLGEFIGENEVGSHTSVATLPKYEAEPPPAYIR